MHTALLIYALAFLAFVGVMGLRAIVALRRRRKEIQLSNIGEGKHAHGKITLYADSTAVLTTPTRYLAVKRGVASNTFTVTTAITDVPLGNCIDTPTTTGDPYAVRLLSAPGTTLFVASGGINQDSFIEATASGQVQTLTTTSGTHYCLGKALNAAVNAGDLIEVDTGFAGPIKY